MCDSEYMASGHDRPSDVSVIIVAPDATDLAETSWVSACVFEGHRTSDLGCARLEFGHEPVPGL
jgi:hypothetical protein